MHECGRTPKIVFADVILVGEGAATHHIEQDIGKVMLGTQRIAGDLHAICPADNVPQFGATVLDVLLNGIVQRRQIVL